MQERLPLEKPSKKDIERLVYYLLRENYGTIPSAGEAVLKDKVWTIPINANYPRLLFDEINKKPKRIRFMSFKDLGEISISEEGNVISKPPYYEIMGIVQSKLKKIRESVEKALIKVAANKFSLLTFPDHMFTPIQDILSWLLVKDSLKLNEFLSNVMEDRKEKYMQNIRVLEDVNIVKVENGLVLPSESLIEIEMKRELTTSQKLAAALTLFYERGYEHLSTIVSFLGPHLILSGYAYEVAIENNEIVSISENQFRDVITESDKSKIVKLPRYLLQLESIDLLKPSRNKDNAWEPNPTIFEKLQGEDELISPIQELMIK